ncbi:hypothetical protein STAS_18752 [Striga asiatica]|uniref:FAF domain-containing protein n=1 Tax=Striga asiatica TaxID=4170 RepID=A0A5A7Q9R4_STRAF|nr:hypothetical protein STAS_18752 [Striga asiatica]
MHNPLIGDCIGLESCGDTAPDFDPLPPPRSRASRRTKAAAAAAAMEHPPPIPFLAPQMPCVMTRHYTGDGRLIIKEEIKRNHKYFEVCRSNGRLVLNLVPIDYVIDEDTMADDRVIAHRCYAYNGGVAANTCGGYAPATAVAFRPPVQT